MRIPPLKERFAVFWSILGLAVITIVLALVFGSGWWYAAFIFIALSLLGLYDLAQQRHAVRRNYPIIGNLRYFFESIRPELRQYFFEDDSTDTPFSRDKRSLAYQRAKQQLDQRAFGTKQDVYSERYEWINHSMQPVDVTDTNFRIQIGGRDCTQPFDLSVLNISAMSFGALSANAVMALNAGAHIGGFAHDTGEGGISRYHLKNGGDLIWNIGSGYFGCRDKQGNFSDENFVANATRPEVKMIELKISQGAKPGQGGILPGSKVTTEIAAARGVPIGQDCLSPSKHTAFSTPVELLEFIARLRKLSGGKPVGFKMCIGHPWEWFAIAKAMLKTGIKPDFIVVDGAEGGTGAAPAELMDHVGTPLREAVRLVHNTLVGLNLRDEIKIGASGKIVTAFDMARIMALGADWCNSARAFMFAVGCIQAQVCHTGNCPTGVTTQDKDRQKALVVSDKAPRVANFHRNTLSALGELIGSAGLYHPADLKIHHIATRTSPNHVTLYSTLFPDMAPGQLLRNELPTRVFRLGWPMASPDSFEPTGNLAARLAEMQKENPEKMEAPDAVAMF
ncbi:FMN-binding glutamate synthase family protein [Orrella sp. 11846]|uniref:FMN-binding glutamate synthase family protein n=1 Tax=Orrella sp. 11846 TaxID=3409913 RepID=UPI003B5AF186